MKATTLLKEDHDRARDLFAKLEAASDAAERRRLFDELRRELTIHAELEESIFYPELRLTQIDDTEEEVLEALEEHQQVKLLLDEMNRVGSDTAQFASKVAELKENVEHHVDEEEGELFPDAVDLLGDARLEEIGSLLARRRATLRSMPTASTT